MLGADPLRLAGGGPAVLEVIIDPMASVYPMVGPGMSYDQMITGDWIRGRTGAPPIVNAQRRTASQRPVFPGIEGSEVTATPTTRDLVIEREIELRAPIGREEMRSERRARPCSGSSRSSPGRR